VQERGEHADHAEHRVGGVAHPEPVVEGSLPCWVAPASYSRPAAAWYSGSRPPKWESGPSNPYAYVLQYTMSGFTVLHAS